MPNAQPRELPEAVPAHLHWWRLPAFADGMQRSRWVWERVRACLAARAGVPAASLAIERTGNGKPLVAQLPFAFSLSHDDDVAVLALATAGSIGVDVLGARALANPRRLARRLYGAHELAQWEALPDPQRQAQLRTRFCAIEAVVKALDWRLWSALGNIHFLRQGKIARVPLKRAQLHLVDGERAGFAWALAADAQIASVQHFEG